MKKKKTKKYRIKYQNLVVFLLVVYILYVGVDSFLKQRITNIYITNNNFLSDEEIIEIARLSDYPVTSINSSRAIKERLEENIYINSAKVYKKNRKEVYIEVEENRPIFYKASLNKTVLLNGKEVEDCLDAPVLINYVPDTIYTDFLNKMRKVDIDILKRISEIEYNPNNVDSERFLLTMNDNNYVYLTLYKFESINSYIDIVKNLENKKGILYLDSGEYFKIMEN